MERDIDLSSALDANYNCSQNYEIWNRTRINSTAIPPPGMYALFLCIFFV